MLTRVLTQSHFKGILEFYLTYSNLDAQEALIFWYRSFREGVAQGEVQRMGRFWTFKPASESSIAGIFGRSSFRRGRGAVFLCVVFLSFSWSSTRISSGQSPFLRLGGLILSHSVADLGEPPPPNILA